ncbi:TetR/AcrR family transcriptional regulator [Zavarzinia sp. CC-PAN008]|uniref:TetR/AcrR family transcriptional regulator n=1 Tax=Zavarzinia sp. CC-PAN008 TaxID=3243332 RepID=UPI003F747A74
MSAGRSAPGRPRNAAADRAIPDAAIALFIEGGIEGCSIEQVARRAGVTRATVYRRWRDKEALLVHALGQVRQREDARAAAGTVPDWSRFGVADLVAYMMGTVSAAMGRGDLGRLVVQLLATAHSHPALIAAYWQAHLAPRRAAFGKALEGMIAQGQLRGPAGGPPPDPDLIQDQLNGALLYRFLLQPGAHPLEERRAYCRRLLAALGFVLPPDSAAEAEPRAAADVC